jgi:hypothetical protein
MFESAPGAIAEKKLFLFFGVLLSRLLQQIRHSSWARAARGTVPAARSFPTNEEQAASSLAG